MNTDKKEELRKQVREFIAVAMADGREEALEFIDQLIWRTHNTEQQRVFKLIHRIIKAFAEKDRFIDGRNEDSHDWCKKVVEAVPEPYFPFI